MSKIPGFTAGFKAGHTSAMTAMEHTDIERLQFISEIMEEREKLTEALQQAVNQLSAPEMLITADISDGGIYLRDWITKTTELLVQCSAPKTPQARPSRVLTQDEIIALMANMRVVESPPEPKQTH